MLPLPRGIVGLLKTLNIEHLGWVHIGKNTYGVFSL